MTTVPRVLQRIYAEAPDRRAVVIQQAGLPDLALTYQELLDGAHGFAQLLGRTGVQPGQVVIIILQHGVELVKAYWGCILLGAVPSIMPFLTEKLSPERYRADLSALIKVTRPAGIITYPEFELEVRAELAAFHATSSQLEGETDASLVVVLPAEAASPSSPDFDRLPGFSRSPEDILLLQHSSGTTGLQKGVALSHGAVLRQLEVYSGAISLDPARDVVVSWLPLYHDMGLIACFILPILMRVPVVMLSPFDWVRAPYRLMHAVSEYRGTLTWLPNFAYNFCAQMSRPRHLEGLDLSSWRAVVNCSEPVRPASHAVFYERFRPFGLREGVLQTCYAMAENVFAVTQSPMDSDPITITVEPAAFISERVVRPVADGQSGLSLMSSGRPLANVELRVVDDSGQDAPERFVGEIALRSDCLLNGYFNRPDATGRAFRDGWYMTGDLGFILDGEIYVTGRKKDLIIVGGKNVYPQDLEALACEVPGVHPGRVVAFGVFSEETGTEEVVILAEADGTQSEETALADGIRQHVTKNSAIALRRVEIVPRKWILKTSSGKVARAANRDKFLTPISQA
jgi:acyl-CoA synthetase (AMP-forming)/AMP-acid ligase II